MGFCLLALRMSDMVFENTSLFTEGNTNGMEGVFSLTLMQEQLLLSLDCIRLITEGRWEGKVHALGIVFGGFWPQGVWFGIICVKLSVQPKHLLIHQEVNLNIQEFSSLPLSGINALL